MIRVFQNLIIKILIGIISGQAYAYPIFYTCHDKILLDTEKIDSDNLFEKILSMTKNEQRGIAEKWCKGAIDCLENLKLIVSFSKTNYEVAEKLFFVELEKIKTKRNSKIEDKDLLNSIISYKKAYSQIQACQNVSNQLSPDDFVHDSKLLVSYPYHSNYMYITGCRSVNGKNCDPMNKQSVDQVIRESISMGTDPYLAIALTLMEEGTSIGSLYLDPIGVMDAIGCSGKQVKNNSDDALNSYGTSYKINSTVQKNKNLSNKLKTFLGSDGSSELEKGTSYYCYDTLGDSKPQIQDKIQSNSCCLELNFKTSDSSTDQVSHALTYEFINKRTKADFRGSKEPEWKIQRFNGYTDLMGGAESVPSWRVGVNYYDNPGYGQQVMDYILNSLMFNPYIKSKVKEQEKALNKNWESILCKSKSNGTYYYDSKNYINLLKNSKRLGVIEEHFKAGKEYEELTDREKQVMNRELRETSSKNSKMPNLLKEAIWNKYEENVSEAIKVNVEDLFIKTAVDPEIIWEKFGKDAKISKGSFDDIMEMWDKSEEMSEELSVVYESYNKIYDKMYKVCQEIYDVYNEMPNSKGEDYDKRKVFYDQYSKCNDDASTLNSVNSIEDIKKIKLDGDSALYSYKEELVSMITKRAVLEKQQENFYKGPKYKKLLKIFNKDQAVIMSYYHERFVYEDLDSALNRLKKLDGYSHSVEKKIKSLHAHNLAQRKYVNYQDAYVEYFEKTYKTRDTLGKTSDYSWELLTPQQVKKIVGKIKNDN
jgi:hypothetical protein